MTSKSDYHYILELDEKYSPAKRGFVNASEMKAISTTLDLSARSNIELQNIRDMTVMFYSMLIDAAKHEDSSPKLNDWMTYSDKMSAVVCVIDNERINRGMAV